jgi:hypothetical protein
MRTRWCISCDVWRVTCDVCHVMCDVWRVTCDMWRWTCDMWRVTYCTSSSQSIRIALQLSIMRAFLSKARHGRLDELLQVGSTRFLCTIKPWTRFIWKFNLSTFSAAACCYHTRFKYKTNHEPVSSLDVGCPNGVGRCRRWVRKYGSDCCGAK